MSGNTHRANCANAQNPGCECSGCGGALHGWQGWTGLAEGTQQARDTRRRSLEKTIEKSKRTGKLSFNARNRQAYIDLARTDIADYLSATGPHPMLDSPPRQPLEIVDAAVISSDLKRATVLANKIMEETWWEISPEIDNLVQNEHSARDIKKHLANHTWCGLLVALIRWIEKIDEAVQFLSDKGKQFVKSVLTEHLSGLSRTLAEAVVNIVIDKVWAALARLLAAHFPLFGEDTLRVLRILALYACPSVEKHPDVYKHAVKPLMGSARELISDEIKTQVTTIFTSWWLRRSPGTAA